MSTHAAGHAKTLGDVTSKEPGLEKAHNPSDAFNVVRNACWLISGRPSSNPNQMHSIQSQSDVSNLVPSDAINPVPSDVCNPVPSDAFNLMKNDCCLISGRPSSSPIRCLQSSPTKCLQSHEKRLLPDLRTALFQSQSPRQHQSHHQPHRQLLHHQQQQEQK